MLFYTSLLQLCYRLNLRNLFLYHLLFRDCTGQVAELFDKKYFIDWGEKYILNVSQANYDMLLNFGLCKNNIQASSLCSYEMNNILHSYRRDGLHSGRALGVIAIAKKENN